MTVRRGSAAMTPSEHCKHALRFQFGSGLRSWLVSLAAAKVCKDLTDVLSLVNGPGAGPVLGLKAGLRPRLVTKVLLVVRYSQI